MKKGISIFLVFLSFSWGVNSFAEFSWGVNSFAESWVAEPKRALAVEWKLPKFVGRDFWTLLEQDWFGLPGVKDERFVQDSGLNNVKLPLVKKNWNPPRVLALKEIEIYESGSGKNLALEAKFELSSKEKETVFFYPERINDGQKDKSVFISADPRFIKKRYQPVTAEVIVTMPKPYSLEKIFIYHGVKSQLCLHSVRISVLKNGNWVPVKYQQQENHSLIQINFNEAVKSKSLRIECLSNIPTIKIGAFSPEVSARCKKYPFYPWCHFRLNQGTLLGLTPENFDRESWSDFLKEYQNTFMGFSLEEWDSNLFQILRRKNPGESLYRDLKEYFPECTGYTNRQEVAEVVRNVWEHQSSLLFNKVWGLSGQLNFPQYGVEWGGRIAGMELAGNSPNFPHRTNLMFTRSAGRQYGKPWLMYLAYYYGSSTANSRVKKKLPGKQQWYDGLNYGIAPSLGRRIFFLSYYLGANFLTFESQPWGQVKEEEDGRCVLTEHGKAIKDIYHWAHSKEGERGTSYTPVLFLLDYTHGLAEYRRGKVWNVWYTLPFEDADYMAEHYIRTIDPYYGAAVGDFPPYSPNLHNSKLGDIFDVFFANPPGGIIRKELLDKYPVVILLGDINISRKLAERLKKYVREGGTLLVNSEQCKSGLQDSSFLGLRLLGDSIEEDGMKIRKVQLEGAKTLLSSSLGLPLLTKYTYGKGNLLFTTPYYMLLKNKKEPSPLIEKILLKLQDEVLPFKVEGDIEFLFNRVDVGTWKVILLNNKGVLKQPTESVERKDFSYTAKVNLSVPAKAAVREVLAKTSLQESVKEGNKVLSLTVPPGEIRVVEIKWR